MRRFLLAGSSLALCLSCFAAGLNNGSSWEDAWTNLASVTWTRDDTYYIAGGTFTESVTISPGAGTSFVTIKKANATDNSGNLGWLGSLATEQTLVKGTITLGASYIEIDGVTGSTNSGHGICVTNRANDVVKGYANIGNVHLHHLEIAGIPYMESSDAYDGFYFSNATEQKGYHISYCYIHDVNKNGLCLGAIVGTSFSDYGLLFENNWMSETGGCTDPGKHGQGVQLCYNNASRYTIFRNNVFRNILGTGIIAFMDGASSHKDSLIYNNLFYATDPKWYNSPGSICCWSGNISNVQVLNCSFYSLSTGGETAQIRFVGSGTTSNAVKNCIWENSNFTTSHAGVDFQLDNGYYNNTGAGVPSGTPGQVNGVATTFTTPASGDFTIKSGGYAIGVGVDLSAIFTTDKVGATRYTPWDIGAYESENLIGYWTLDEGSGTSAADSSGYGNTGSFTNGTAWGPGRIGSYSASIDGVDDMVRIPFSVNWDFTGDFSVSAWVFCTTNSRVVAVGRWASDLWNGWSLEQITSNRFDFEYQDRNAVGQQAHRSLGSGLGYTTNTWHFVTGVKSNDVVRIFVDGNAGTISEAITNSIVMTGKGINIGSRRDIAPDDAQWRGYVDDVRIYNRLLTVAEITALYNEGTPEEPEEPEEPVASVSRAETLHIISTLRGP
jgi:hypothetical protein